ncbi:MAG: transposase [Bacteroidota bacterium]
MVDNPDKTEILVPDFCNCCGNDLRSIETQKDYRDYLFTFLYNIDVPPDNNGSERGVRNFKVKLKVSGQFKTGQNTFAKIRSIIDTCKKNKIPVLPALNLVAQMPIFAGV